MAKERETAESLALDTAISLSQASALLARAGGRTLAGRGITWPQALSLLVLADQDAPISATRLVEHLGLGRTAMTSVVDRLERNGWVERRPSLLDRRTADLLLTEAGTGVVDQIRPIVLSLAGRYFAVFTPRDLDRFAADLTRLSTAHMGKP